MTSERLDKVDEGVAPETTITPGRATVVNCGRRPGYFEETLQRLLALCEKAGPSGVINWD